MIAINKDGASAAVLTKLQRGTDFLYNEDGTPLTPSEVLQNYDRLAPAPDDFKPHFMRLRTDDQ